MTASGKFGFWFLILYIGIICGANSVYANPSVQTVSYNGFDYATPAPGPIQYPVYEKNDCKARLVCGAVATNTSSCKSCIPCTCTIERRGYSGGWTAESSSPYKNEICANDENAVNGSVQQCRQSTATRMNGFINDEWAACQSRCL